MSKSNFQDWNEVVFHKKPVKNSKAGSGSGSGPGLKKASVVGNTQQKQESAHLRKLDEAEVGRHKTVSSTLRQAISRGRAEKGMKQKELANLLNVKSTVIQDYESGKAIPDGRLLARMERVLGVKLTGKKKEQGKKLPTKKEPKESK